MLDDATPTNYRIFKLKNKEFTFDVDVSNVGCGLNGALYFVEMDADGGMANSDKGLNKAGAKFGTGYCDAQCANDIKFIGGVANIVDWTHTNPNGTYGSCCAEMDIWEANSQSTQMTPHPCSFEGALRCEGQDCGNRADRAQSVCDMDGCDFNPYRMGNKNFFGAGADFAVDSTKPMTVVTQFLTDDGTDDGDLTEIRRFYVQDGQTIENPRVSMDGLDAYDSITAANCDAQKKLFGEPNTFKNHGGFKAISDAMGRGMVLVLSLWDDSAANMLWLDSTYLGAANETGFGAERGPCATDSGVPADIEAATPDAWTSFTNIKIGEIGSTTAPTLALV
jgi:cellulose 1,4-beta-cellobiosidase